MGCCFFLDLAHEMRPFKDSATTPTTASTMQNAVAHLILFSLLRSAHALCATVGGVPPRGVPQSADEMMQRAAAAVARGVEAGVLRQTIKVAVPDDTREYKVFGAVPIQGTSAPEDLDPWPGGLKQQYPIALGLGRQLLCAVTKSSGSGGCKSEAAAGGSSRSDGGSSS